MTIALIGYRGAGKSATAQQLALRLGWDWIDADVEVELRAGKSIAAIFADDGELAFRDLEAAVLADLLTRDRTVLALGGASFCGPPIGPCCVGRTASSGLRPGPKRSPPGWPPMPRPPRAGRISPRPAGWRKSVCYSTSGASLSPVLRFGNRYGAKDSGRSGG